MLTFFVPALPGNVGAVLSRQPGHLGEDGLAEAGQTAAGLRPLHRGSVPLCVAKMRRRNRAPLGGSAP